MQVELEGYTKDPEISIAKAGAISHENEIEHVSDARELNKKLIDWGHLSPVEFSSATFYVEEVSRVFLAQLSRHRHINLMVQSFRYTEPNDGLVIPDSIQEWVKDTTENQDSLDQVTSSVDWLYDRLVEDGVPKEDARMLKFMGEKTKLYVRANFREWRHIIDLRGLNEDAQHEIRMFAQTVLKELYHIAPSVFGDQYEKLGDM